MARILIVDNEDAYRTTLSKLFSREGHETRCASSGPEAIALGMEFRPEALVVDWGLRGPCDGLDVSRELQIEDPNLRVLLITGHSAADVDEAAKARIFRILEKPFGLDEMSEALASALDAALHSVLDSPLGSAPNSRSS